MRVPGTNGSVTIECVPASSLPALRFPAFRFPDSPLSVFRDRGPPSPPLLRFTERGPPSPPPGSRTAESAFAAVYGTCLRAKTFFTAIIIGDLREKRGPPPRGGFRSEVRRPIAGGG